MHEAFRLLPVKADFDAHRIKFPMAVRGKIAVGSAESGGPR